ncbi:MAG: hypothetical protein ACREKE_07925, partial [bacterium]
LYILPLRAHLKTRREGIVKELEGAEAARHEAEVLRAELARERISMSEELKAARLEAREEVAKLRADLLANAEQQQEALFKQSRERIERESRRALAEIRGQAAALVVEASGRFLAKKLDDRTDLALAERLVASVKASKN